MRTVHQDFKIKSLNPHSEFARFDVHVFLFKKLQWM